MNMIRKVIPVILFSMTLSCSMFRRNLVSPEQVYTFAENPNGQLLWSMSNAYLAPDNNLPSMVGSPDQVMLVGLDALSMDKQMLTIDSTTGKVLWKNMVELPSPIIVDATHIYQGGSSILRSFELQRGNLVWETNIPNAGNMMYMSSTPQKILIVTSSGRSYTISLDGKVLSESDRDYSYFPFLSGEEIYAMRGYIFEARDDKTGQVIWIRTLNEEIVLQPLFSGDMIFIRTGIVNTLGKIYALNRKNGQTAWVSDKNVISNLGVLDSYVFYLGKDNNLQFLDRKDGQERFSLTFSPQRMVTSHFKSAGGTFVSSDDKNKIVFVSFGDSYQVFAIKMSK
jgi:outer membrane protein assembly factor BamB